MTAERGFAHKPAPRPGRDVGSTARTAAPLCQRAGLPRYLQGKGRVNAEQSSHKDVTGNGGRPLDPVTRDFFEPRFGRDFEAVRVHDGGSAADSARALNARAYTSGQHIVFGEGQYVPGSDAGKELLAHELTHVVQQNSTSSRPSTTLQRRVMMNTAVGGAAARWLKSPGVSVAAWCAAVFPTGPSADWPTG